MNKFKENVNDFVNMQISNIEIRYKIKINLELYLCIAYYKKIEKRGFRIFDDVTKRELTENILFSSAILTY